MTKETKGYIYKGNTEELHKNRCEQSETMEI